MDSARSVQSRTCVKFNAFFQYIIFLDMKIYNLKLELLMYIIYNIDT